MYKYLTSYNTQYKCCFKYSPEGKATLVVTAYSSTDVHCAYLNKGITADLAEKTESHEQGCLVSAGFRKKSSSRNKAEFPDQFIFHGYTLRDYIYVWYLFMKVINYMLKLVRLEPGTKLNKTYTEVQTSTQMSIFR